MKRTATTISRNILKISLPPVTFRILQLCIGSQVRSTYSKATYIKHLSFLLKTRTGYTKKECSWSVGSLPLDEKRANIFNFAKQLALVTEPYNSKAYKPSLSFLSTVAEAHPRFKQVRTSISLFIYFSYTHYIIGSVATKEFY